MADKYTREHRKDKHKKQFVCQYCGRIVAAEAPGTGHRNHCPWCLRSVHLDVKAGDRAALCRSIMEPIAISVRQGKEWVIIHRCTGCGALRENRIAGDDNEMALLSLAVRPVARPPFPLDGLLRNNYDDEKEGYYDHH
jgi:ribosome biogenesis GTPase